MAPSKKSSTPAQPASSRSAKSNDAKSAKVRKTKAELSADASPKKKSRPASNGTARKKKEKPSTVTEVIVTDVLVTKADRDAIARRAFEIWHNAGRPEGRDLEHWVQAERELLSESASTISA